MATFKSFIDWWNQHKERVVVDEDRIGMTHGDWFKCKSPEQANHFAGFAEFMFTIKDTELSIIFSNLPTLIEIFNSLPKKYHLWITDGKLNYAPIMESY